MDSSLIVMIVLGLLVLLSFVVAYFSARTWAVTNVLLAAGVFLVSVVFIILASAVLKTQAEWRGQYNELRADLDSELAKTRAMLQGDATATGPGETLPGLKLQRHKEILNRGRVWRNVKPQDAGAGGVMVDMRGFGDAGFLRLAADEDDEFDPEAQGEAEPAPKEHGIQPDTILYVFQETTLSELGDARSNTLFADSDLPERDSAGLCRLPTQYLGQFKVSAADQARVTLQPTLPLDAQQVEQIQQAVAAAEATWALYEVMPIDSHDVYAKMTAEQMQSLLPQDMTGLDGEAYASLIDQYVRDDTPARAGDVDARTKRKVKFLKPYQIDVDVEQTDASGMDVADRDYDSSGLAVAADLRQGEPSRFGAGSTAILDTESANKLVQAGVCELEEEQPVYFRPLRDYDYFFQEISLRFQELGDQTAMVQQQTDGVIAASKEAEKDVQFRADEKQKLEQDLSGFQREMGVVASLLEALQTQHSQTLARLSEMYRENSRLAIELSRLQQQVLARSGRP